MTTVLSIDQGTSGTKAIVVGPAGRIAGTAERAVRPRYAPGGAVEQDPEALLRSVIEAGREAVARAGLPVGVVTLANQGETVLAWDPRTGRPLSDMIVWQDRRAESICAGLDDQRQTFAARTGLVLDPYFSAPKMAWLRAHVTREGVVTTSDSWLLHRLTGAFVTDASTAGRSLITGLDTAAWDPELLALFGLDAEPLPEIVSCDALVGTTDAFGGTLPVGGLVVDQQAALAGGGCLAPGDLKCTFGTGAFLLANTGAGATRSRTGLAASVAWRVRGRTTYCLDGQVYAAAAAVRWMQRLGLAGPAAELDRVAAPDAGGVLAVPSLAGLAAPWWRPDATASLTGMTLSTTAGHLVTAVLQGIAAQVAELGDAVARDLGRPLTRLRADGGLTGCRTLMQAVADVMQLPVEVFPSPHGTALGAAAFARMSVAPDLSLADAVIPWTPRVVHTPRWNAERAAAFREQWRRAALG
ncbi:FGGY family carbohydrate kinase [Catenuloplanes sp. NPDC051500]|uniref:FGGY family carbohydrate kinase n=1 Tax=Catenuloplanes sp. NPDC051500 TaxID=3363959 RepID=UPI003796CEE6